MEKIVGFVGYECEDIVLYLAKILIFFGKRTAIVDRTEQEMLIEIIGFQQKEECETREGDFNGIWVTSHGVCQEDYDVIFYLFGYRLVHPKLYECSMLIMVTDGVPAHASLLKKVGCWERKQYLVIRNLVPLRHTEEYLAMLAGNKGDYCEIPYDEGDIRMRCSLSAYAVCKIKVLSYGMKKALALLICFVYSEFQERNVCKIIGRL